MACAPTLAAALQALSDSPLRAADRKAGVRRAVELYFSGPVIPTAPEVSVAKVDDSSFNPFDELQAVHAAVKEAGRDGSTARAVRDALREFGEEGHRLANVTDRLRKHRNLKGHHPVGLARAVGTLFSRAPGSVQTACSVGSDDEATSTSSTISRGKVDEVQSCDDSSCFIVSEPPGVERYDIASEAGEVGSNVEVQTEISFPDVDIICFRADSPQSAVDNALRWTAGEQLHAMRACQMRVDDLLENLVDDPFHNVVSLSCLTLELTVFDFEKVRGTCAKASAALERFRKAAVASDHGHGSEIKSVECTTSIFEGDDLVDAPVEILDDASSARVKERTTLALNALRANLAGSHGKVFIGLDVMEVGDKTEVVAQFGKKLARGRKGWMAAVDEALRIFAEHGLAGKVEFFGEFLC
jgi:hypothetical protein